MGGSFRKLLVALAVLLVFAGALVIVATLAQVADAADRVHVGAGQVVFWALLAVFAALVAAPLMMIARLPKARRPPATRDEPAYSAYLAQVCADLRRNRHLAGLTLDTPTDLELALHKLGAEADRAALAAASTVFVGTALMQNGRLDGLVVLAAQVRVVWRILSIYNTRPTPAQVAYIYANVSASVLAAGAVDDIDFAELGSPIVTAVAPALAASVPGLGGISRLLVNSVAGGGANAFLTLRVAMLTREYCASLLRPDPVELRRRASAAALLLLGSVTSRCSARVVKTILRGAVDAARGAGSTTTQAVRSAGAKLGGATLAAAQGVKDKVRQFGRGGRPEGDATDPGDAPRPVEPSGTEGLR
jgi:hypothetical protein